MKINIIKSILVLLLALPLSHADNVTVHGSLGMLRGHLVTKKMDPVGTVNVYNNNKELNLIVTPDEGYLLSKVYVYLNPEPPPPPALEGEEVVEPDFGDWPYSVVYKKNPTSEPYVLTLNFEDDLDFQWGHWGPMWLEQRLLTVGVRVELKTTDAVPVTLTAWGLNINVPEDVQFCGWGDNALAQRYEVQHPHHGQFAPGPVLGLHYGTPTQAGTIGSDGGFWFFPGEYVLFYIGDLEIGYAQADQRLTPLDIFPSSDPYDPPVVNMARLLQSLDTDGESNGSIDITDSTEYLEQAVAFFGLESIDFYSTEEMDTLIAKTIELANADGLNLVEVSAEDAAARLIQSAGNLVMRRNISKSPEYAVDKPKLDIMPVWVPAKTASGLSTTVEYLDDEGNTVALRNKVKPLFVTYTEMQEPNYAAGITRSGSDIITAVSMDDGATWKRFNVSKMATKSSITLENGERFPGDSRGPQQKIAEDKILVVWTSAYARGGKPSFAIRTDDDYPYDDPYAVTDHWGVRGKQGSVNYDEDKDVGDQGIGEIPYYALWACRGVLIWEGNVGRFPGHEIGEVVWFKPERLTSGRRDAFFAVASSAKNVGFAIAWQEDPGGLLPGSCKGGGDGWSGATVHKKTDIWYSFIPYADFEKIDVNFSSMDPDHASDEFGGPDEHGQQPEISNRPKWLVPMSLPVRVSDNNAVNTENLKVQLDATTGLPVIDPVTGGYIPLDGAIEEDYLASEHEAEGGCGEEGDGEGEGEGGQNGTGGGWGMARYAYMIPTLDIADQTTSSTIWDGTLEGDFRPEYVSDRWYRFINKPGFLKTVVVTADGRVLDGDTGACRPNLMLRPGGWAILGYEETKGLGEPPEGEHDDTHDDTDIERPEPDDSGKNVIYHSFKFNQPDLVSAGNILNLPALDDDGELIPIYYKDAAGESTDIFRQYKTENARRVRFISQPKPWMGSTRTSMMAIYKQGREGSGKPSDVFGVRAVVPSTDKSSDNPYRFSNLIRYDTGSETSDPNVMKHQRRHMNMSAATVEGIDPVEKAGDNEGNTWNKVGKWKQYQGNMSDESFSNPYSDAKAHRGFLRGDKLVFGYSFTPNWGRLGGDHMDFYVRRSFDGGQTWTTDPNGPEETVHTVIERDPDTGEYHPKQYRYGRGEFEPGRNVSVLKGNSHTVTDPRLVPPMGPGTVNKTYPEDDTPNPDVFYVTFGTAKVLHGIGEPLGVTDTEKEDIFYTRTTDSGSTWLQVPWIINPDSQNNDGEENPDAEHPDNVPPVSGETVYRWPWLAHGTPHQGHSQIRMHPSGTRFYAIWHQWSDGDEGVVSPHDAGNDIWFRRIDFMTTEE